MGRNLAVVGAVRQVIDMSLSVTDDGVRAIWRQPEQHCLTGKQQDYGAWAASGCDWAPD